MNLIALLESTSKALERLPGNKRAERKHFKPRCTHREHRRIRSFYFSCFICHPSGATKWYSKRHFLGIPPLNGKGPSFPRLQGYFIHPPQQQQRPLEWVPKSTNMEKGNFYLSPYLDATRSCSTWLVGKRPPPHRANKLPELFGESSSSQAKAVYS